jgi:hypothetical protein
MNLAAMLNIFSTPEAQALHSRWQQSIEKGLLLRFDQTLIDQLIAKLGLKKIFLKT